MRVFSFLMLLIVAAILLTSNLVSATEDKDLYGGVFQLKCIPLLTIQLHLLLATFHCHDSA